MLERSVSQRPARVRRSQRIGLDQAIAALVWTIGALLLVGALEWLFYMTSPTPLAVAPWSARIAVLIRGVAHLVIPASTLALAFTAVALIHRRLSAVAFVPAAIAGSTLVLLLVDNFTYVVLGFNSSGATGPARALYSLLFVTMIVLLAGRASRAAATPPSPQRHRGRMIFCGVALLIGATELEPNRQLALALLNSGEHAHRLPGEAVAQGDSSKGMNVLLFGIDGVPADRMSVYGYRRDTTPFLREFRDRLIVYENAYPNCGSTYGSLISLLTGRHPMVTRVAFPPLLLKGEAARRHLPGLLNRDGYNNLQLTMRHQADAGDANLEGAFDWANYRWSDGAAPMMHRSTNRWGDVPELYSFRNKLHERVRERMAHILWMRDSVNDFEHLIGRKLSPYWSDTRRIDTLIDFIHRRPQPWFVHLHLLDTHCCEREPVSRHFSTGSGSPEDKFDDSIREADAALRRVVTALHDTNQLERTIIVVSSDHSENWSTVVRLPLLIYAPGIHGYEVETAAQSIDIAPTILSLLGRPIPSWMDGRLLIPPPVHDVPVYGLTSHQARVQVGANEAAADLRDVSPPNFGASRATIVYGPRWARILLGGTTSTGEVIGYTGHTPPLSDEQLLRMLDAQLERHGYELGRR